MDELNHQKHEGQYLDILFVIVLYKIKLEQSPTYISVLNSLNGSEFNIDLLVYDNSPADPEYNFNGTAAINIIYIADKTNSGVSRAYNTGAELAVKMKKKWMLLLDQDTIFPDNFICKYLETIEMYPREKLFAPLMLTDTNKIISPCIFKFGRGFYGKEMQAGIYKLKNRSLINCGLCIELKSFKKINGYNEKIKLDFSDHDFINRFSRAVSSQFVLIDLQVEHQLSTTMKTSLGNEIVRFDHYLEGSKQFSNSLQDSFFLNTNAFLRSLKLSMLYKNLIFFKIFLNYISKKNV